MHQKVYLGVGGANTRLLGTVEVMTNKRITIPSKLLDTLKAKEGDFLLFYEDDNGKVIVKMEKG
jgi:AbrB family looped-hinge helix DNA binding protein